MTPRKDPQTGAIRLQAVLFDMDGVITDTAEAHMAAWKKVFDAWLKARHPQERPFSAEDYRRHVDGRPRLDGVTGFLESRGIVLPRGHHDDRPEADTVLGLANEKLRRFRQWLGQNRVRILPGSRDLVAALGDAGLRTALFTASRNAEDVLASAGLSEMFDVTVDGREMAAAGLPGKPDPAIMLRAAARLGIAPANGAIVEDSIAGIKAGLAGGFAQVIGVARTGDTALQEAGATPVVADLSALAIAQGPRLVVKEGHDMPPQ